MFLEFRHFKNAYVPVASSCGRRSPHFSVALLYLEESSGLMAPEHGVLSVEPYARGAVRRRRRRHHGHRGQGLRPPEGPHRALSRRRVRGRLPAQDQARSGRHRRTGPTRWSRRSCRPPAPARSATARSSSGTSNAWCASAPARAATATRSHGVAVASPARAHATHRWSACTAAGPPPS